MEDKRSNGLSYLDRVRDFYNSVNDTNWREVGMYVGLGTLCAAVGGSAGYYFGPEIADLIGVKSQFMGMERMIASKQITNGGVILGGLIGLLTAYLVNRRDRR